MKRYLATLLIAPLLAVAQAAPASCPPDALDRGPGESWLQLYQRLAPYIEQCYDNADFLALLGAAGLRTGQTRDAALLLERSIMLSPEQAGAAVDYAQALYLLQQPYAALELNRQLIEQANDQPELNQYLQQRQIQWDRNLSRQQTSLYLQAGHDTNLGRASDLSTLNLTLPDGTLSLALAPEQRAQAGNSLYWGVKQRHIRLLPDGERHLYWQLDGRESSHHTHDRLELNLGIARRLHWLQHSLNAGLDFTHLSVGHHDLYSSLTPHLTYTYQGNHACAPLVTGSSQIRRFPGRHTLDGTELRLSLGAQCHYDEVELSLLGGLKTDLAADNNRAGGNRQGYDAILQLHAPLGSGQLDGSLQHTILRDESGYSELLSHNQRRVTRYTSLQLGYMHPVGRQQAISISAQHLFQESNISLFELEATELRLGWHLQL